MAQYIFMGIILLAAIVGMIAAYWCGRYAERKRIIRELTKTGIDFDGDTMSTIDLSRIVFNNPHIISNRSIGGDQNGSNS